MIRDTAEPTVLRGTGPARDASLAVPAGTRVVVDLVGLRASLSPLRTASPLTDDDGR